MSQFLKFGPHLASLFPDLNLTLNKTGVCLDILKIFQYMGNLNSLFSKRLAHA